jgi:uncharacterized membrane protein
MSVTTIARGGASRVTNQRRVLARTDDEWHALWAIHAGPAVAAPAVDLSRVVIAAAFAGERASTGHSIDITGIRHPGGIRLAVVEHTPGPDTIAAAILTSPFHIVAVDRTAGEVSWEEVGGWRTEAGSISASPSNLQPPTSSLQLSSTGLEPRTASTLAYLAGPFSGVLILLAESTSDDVRFHAWQSIVGLGGLGLAVITSYVLAVAALFVSATAVSLMVGVASVIWIVLAIVWAICLWKAWSGERWKLPLAGDYAERLVAHAVSPAARRM